jgi:hypothetical protein
MKSTTVSFLKFIQRSTIKKVKDLFLLSKIIYPCFHNSHKLRERKSYEKFVVTRHGGTCL